MNNKPVRVCVTLPAWEKERLKTRAATAGMTLQEYLVLLIRKQRVY